jgi:hypothetical protein
VDFDVYKALTARRETEAMTYNDVLRDMLNLGKPGAPAPTSTGVTFKGIFFPDGTLFEASYKGQRYTATVKHGAWVDDATGEKRTSPSDAVRKITETNVNGWRFWRCKRPGETGWTLLDKLQ